MLWAPFRTRLCALLVVLSTVLSATANSAPVDRDPERSLLFPDIPEDGEIRTGTTSVQAPQVPPTRGAAEPGDAEQGAHAPPADSPRFGGQMPELPAAPPSHTTQSRGWIRFTYHPSIRAQAQRVIEQAEGIRRELSARLGQPVLKKVTVHIARTPGEMVGLAPQGAPYPKYAAGVAYPQLGLILLTVAPVHPNSQHDLVEVFRHELAHLALNDAVSGNPVPRWFNEGFAVFASDESSLARWQTLWTASLSDNLLPLEKLERTFPADDATASVAYAQAVDVVRFLVRRQEEQRFGALIARLNAGQSFDRALKDAYGTDLATLEFEWREDVSRRFTFWPVLFSGSMVWGIALGLFVWGWRRRNKRNRETLARWAREEAAQELEARVNALPNPRMHIVLTRAPPRIASERRPQISEVEIPKVEHEGQWHTLH